MGNFAGSTAGIVVGGIAVLGWYLWAFDDLYSNRGQATPMREPAPNRQYRIGFAVSAAITMIASAPWFTPIFLALALVDTMRLIGRRRRKLYWRNAIIEALTQSQGKPLSALELSKQIDAPTGTIYPYLARLESEGTVTSDWTTSLDKHPGVGREDSQKPRGRAYWIAASS